MIRRPRPSPLNWADITAHNDHSVVGGFGRLKVTDGVELARDLSHFSARPHSRSYTPQ